MKLLLICLVFLNLKGLSQKTVCRKFIVKYELKYEFKLAGNSGSDARIDPASFLYTINEKIRENPFILVTTANGDTTVTYTEKRTVDEDELTIVSQHPNNWT